VGWHVPHGDGQACAQRIESITELPSEQLRTMGQRARQFVDERYTQARLLGEFSDAVEAAIRRRWPESKPNAATAAVAQTRT
jgi:hypothetical protein